MHKLLNCIRSVLHLKEKTQRGQFTHHCVDQLVMELIQNSCVLSVDQPNVATSNVGRGEVGRGDTMYIAVELSLRSSN